MLILLLILLRLCQYVNFNINLVVEASLCCYLLSQEKVKEFGILKENMFAFWDVSNLSLKCPCNTLNRKMVKRRKSFLNWGKCKLIKI